MVTNSCARHGSSPTPCLLIFFFTNSPNENCTKQILLNQKEKQTHLQYIMFPAKHLETEMPKPSAYTQRKWLAWAHGHWKLQGMIYVQVSNFCYVHTNSIIFSLNKNTSFAKIWSPVHTTLKLYLKTSGMCCSLDGWKWRHLETMM